MNYLYGLLALLMLACAAHYTNHSYNGMDGVCLSVCQL